MNGRRVKADRNIVHSTRFSGADVLELRDQDDRNLIRVTMDAEGVVTVTAVEGVVLVRPVSSNQIQARSVEEP